MAGIDKKYEKMLAGRKRRNARKKFFLFLKILFALIFFGALVFGANYFYNSSYFRIKEITVSGNNFYKPEEILKQASVQTGVNIFEVDKKNVEGSLTGNLVRLKSASIKKIFPDRIEINILERKPFLIAVYSSMFYILDNEGIVLEALSGKIPDEYKSLILVKNGLRYYPETGEKIAKKNILSCADIYGSLDLEIKKMIREAYISDSPGQDIIMVTVDSKQIIFGTSDKIIDKNAILRKILEEAIKSGTRYSVIDLRNIENPVIK